MPNNSFLENVEIYQARLSDIDMFIQFLLSEYAYNRGNPNEATPDFFGLREEAIVSIINALAEDIQDKSVIFLLVKSKIGHILGWGQVSFHRKDVELVSLYLTNPVRRKGIGDLLLKEIIKKTRQKGATRIVTIIQKNNLVAKHFLEQHDFKIIETFDLETEDFIFSPFTVHKLSFSIK